VVRTLLRPAKLLAPLNGSDRITPAIGDFYFWASSRSVTLPTSRYNYSSDWTPLLAGLAPAGTAASFAAPTLTTERPATVLLGPVLHRLDSASHTGAFGYSVPVRHHLIDPIRPTRGHTAISPHSGLYAMPSLCGST